MTPNSVFDMLLEVVLWLKGLLEYAGGATDAPPAGCWLSLRSLAWGAWWGGLACLIYIFGGQSSKFIYIDF